MAHIGILPATDDLAAEPVTMRRMEVATAPASGFWPCAVSPDDIVPEGDQIGTMRGLASEWERPIMAEHSGTVLYKMTSLGVTGGKPLIGIAV